MPVHTCLISLHRRGLLYGASAYSEAQEIWDFAEPIKNTFCMPVALTVSLLTVT